MAPRNCAAADMLNCRARPAPSSSSCMYVCKVQQATFTSGLVAALMWWSSWNFTPRKVELKCASDSQAAAATRTRSLSGPWRATQQSLELRRLLALFRTKLLVVVVSRRHNLGKSEAEQRRLLWRLLRLPARLCQSTLRIQRTTTSIIIRGLFVLNHWGAHTHTHIRGGWAINQEQPLWTHFCLASRLSCQRSRGWSCSSRNGTYNSSLRGHPSVDEYTAMNSWAMEPDPPHLQRMEVDLRVMCFISFWQKLELISRSGGCMISDAGDDKSHK